jgi:hypothetical protein
MHFGKMSPDGAVAKKSKTEAVFYPQAGYSAGRAQKANTHFSAFLRGLFEKRRKKADTAKTAETDIGNFARALERKADTPNGLFCLRELSEAGRARHDRDRRARAQAAELDNGTARSR